MQKSLARRVVDFAIWRRRRLAIRYHSLMDNAHGWLENRRFAREGPQGIDPRVAYPSYKPLDGLVDVGHLRALDPFLERQVRRYLREVRCEPFTTGTLKKGLTSKSRPGSRTIPLTVSKRGRFRYFDLDDTDLWEPSPEARDFEPLLEFIATLPFARTGRILIMCDDRGRAVTPHRDHARTEVCHEFVWFRTNLAKPFFLQDAAGRGPKLYVRSYSAWFDTVNQFHGADAVDQLSVSVRVDGHFTDEFRARIPEAGPNRASRAALWAAVEADAQDGRDGHAPSGGGNGLSATGSGAPASARERNG